VTSTSEVSKVIEEKLQVILEKVKELEQQWDEMAVSNTL
jgi:antitoxin component HigA of HigAB toxin-antitoxin module